MRAQVREAERGRTFLISTSRARMDFSRFCAQWRVSVIYMNFEKGQLTCMPACSASDTESMNDWLLRDRIGIKR